MNKINHLVFSGTLFTIVLFLWPIFMALFPPLDSNIEQIEAIKSNPAVYKLQFEFAFLIAPSIVYIMIAQLNIFSQTNSISLKLGYIFLTAYLIFVSISYASQVIIVPRLINNDLVELAQIWLFSSSDSIAYFLNQLGYCFWAIAAILLFGKLIKEKGIIKYISIIYFVSALLSVVAFVGLIIENNVLNSLTVVSGLLLAPVGILSIIWGVKEK